MIKLLIIEASSLMRRQLAALFDSEGDFQIDQARNGKEALEKNRSFQPDVMILDLHLLKMNDIAALSLLLAKYPVPAVVLSSFSDKEMLTAFEKMNFDMVNYITRPNGNISLSIGDIWLGLLAKVRAIAFFQASRNKEESKQASTD